MMFTAVIGVGLGTSVGTLAVVLLPALLMLIGMPAISFLGLREEWHDIADALVPTIFTCLIWSTVASLIVVIAKSLATR